MDIHQTTLAAWASNDVTPATPEDIGALLQYANGRLPDDYVQFVRTFGFPRWPLETASVFSHVHDLGHRQVTKTDDLGYLIKPDDLKYTEHALSHSLPNLSPRLKHAIPLAGTFDGHAVLALELEPIAGQVWYWSEENEWVDFEKITLGFVAESFTSFIEGLRVPDD